MYVTPDVLSCLMLTWVAAAKLVMLGPDQSLNGQTKAALSFYMHKYLEFLQNAGFHTLYDLPDFENKLKAKIDHSLHYRPIDLEVLCAGVSVYGTNIQELAGSLHRKWLNVASIGLPEDPLSICLAELDSAWLGNAEIEHQFYARFGPPRITALCGSEVILYFDVQDIAFFVGEAPK